MRAETHVNNEWQRLGGSQKVRDGRFGKEVWVDGSEERIWKPSLRIRLRW